MISRKSLEESITTTDDRGNTVEIRTILAVYASTPPTDPRMLALWRRVHVLNGRTLKSSPAPLAIVPLVLIFLLALYVLSLLGVQGFALQTGSLLVMLLGARLIGGFLSTPLQRQSLAMLPRLVEAHLDEGICPGCGYNLHGLTAAPDGAVECPECGAAWRSDRLKRLEPIIDRSVDATDRVIERAVSTGVIMRENTGTFTTDSRGAAVPLLKERTLASTTHASSELNRRASAVLRDLASLRLRRRLLLGLMLALAVLVTAIVAALEAEGLIVTVAILILIAFGLGMVALLARDETDTVDAATRHGLCASCGADLARRAPDPDGCTVCPECRAAWRLPPHPSP